MGEQDQTGQPPRPAVPARRRGRPVLRAFVIVIGALVLIGGATGVYLYDRATAIDRSTPAVVARQFMRASMVERDPARVGLFICGDWTAQQALAETAAQIDPEVKASWTVGTAEPLSEGRATVPILMMLQYPGEVAPSGREGWVLSLHDEQGWRVCSVDRGTGP